jgi:hypothetical protein
MLNDDNRVAADELRSPFRQCAFMQRTVQAAVDSMALQAGRMRTVQPLYHCSDMIHTVPATVTVATRRKVECLSMNQTISATTATRTRIH